VNPSDILPFSRWRETSGAGYQTADETSARRVERVGPRPLGTRGWYAALRRAVSGDEGELRLEYHSGWVGVTRPPPWVSPPVSVRVEPGTRPRHRTRRTAEYRSVEWTPELDDLAMRGTMAEAAQACGTTEAGIKSRRRRLYDKHPGLRWHLHYGAWSYHGRLLGGTLQEAWASREGAP
jgi:hypothetical protein